MKRLLAITAVLALASGVAMAQTVVNSKHDLSSTGGADPSFLSNNVTRVCIFCHVPHQDPSASGQDPLWNHRLSSEASYGVYSSDTRDFTPTDIGGASAGTAGVSNLCMSCHDGTIGLGNLYNEPNTGTPSNSGTLLTGAALTGTDLTNDHPINFDYTATPTSIDPEINDPADYPDSVDAAGDVPLFGGTVQCGSCHDPHDPTYTPFLVVDNTDSALCTVCHAK